MVLFRVRDPLGNQMRLYYETWWDHVIGEDHPEMVPYLPLVRGAVASPREIWSSKHSDRRIIYYQEVPDRPHLDIAVVGDVRHGTICTAYLYAPRSSRGGKRLWPK